MRVHQDHPTGALDVWASPAESNFVTKLGEQLERATAAQTEALRKAEALASTRFEEEFGLTVGEAVGLKARHTEVIARAEAAEVMISELRAALVKAQDRAAAEGTAEPHFL